MPRCTFDDNAVANYVFTSTHISTADYFHPSVEGQRVLATVTWAYNPLSEHRVSGDPRTLRSVTEDVVAVYLDGVPEPTRAALTELCRIIAGSDPRVRAEIKWSAPSFAIDDHFATTGVLKGGGVRLVLHTGARRKGAAKNIVIDDPEKLLDWRDADRAIAVFADARDVRQQERALGVILDEWIAQTQRLKS